MVFIITISQQNRPVLVTMKILLLTTLLAFAAADVSHLLNQGNPGYQYQNPSFQNAPESSYGAPQASVLGNLDGSGSIQSVSYSNSGVPQLTLPGASGPSLQFNSGLSSIGGGSSISGATIQTYDNGGFSTPVPLTQDSLARFQVSTPSSIGSAPSVNFVKYQEPSNSYQFLSKYNQPSASAVGLGSDASLNSGSFSSDSQFNAGLGFGGNTASSIDTQFNSGLGLGGSQFVSNSAGIAGSINDAFGVDSGSVGVSGQQAESHLEPEVSKHLYFFDAPEDEEEVAEAKINIPPVAPKKTYKIIFIKAPTYRNQGTITIPAPPATEEKTLVYVLVKKPENNANVRFESAVPTKPSKPEVFFIKYKTQKDAEAAVAEIQNKHGATGQVIANLPAGQTVDHIQIPSDTQGKNNGFGGSSFDSFGSTSFGSSSPSAFGIEARAGVQSSQDESQQKDSDSAQSENAQTNVQIGQGVAAGPSSVSFGQQSSFQSLGGAVTVASGHSEASVSNAVASEVNNESNVDAGDSDQEESQNESSSSQPEESENNENDQTLIQERIGSESSDSEGQGSDVSGFRTYGAPDPSLFKKYGPPEATSSIIRIHPVPAQNETECTEDDVKLVCKRFLPKGRFPNIKSLHISDVKLEKLDFNFFTRYFPNLSNLSIIGNNRTKLRRFEMPKEGAKIRVLQLSNLQISNFNNNFTDYFPQLESLNISGNFISEFPKFSFRGLKKVYLADNRWNCNYSLEWALELNKTVFEDLKILRCFGMPHNNKPVYAIADFRRITAETCTPKCSCHLIKCVTDMATGILEPIIEVNCSFRRLTQLPETFPLKTKILRLEGNFIEDLRPLKQNLIYRNLLEIYLDNNNVTNLHYLEGSYWLTHLRVFSLRNNKITELPAYAIDNALQHNVNMPDAVRITLGGNPWRCDCIFAPRFKAMLQKYAPQIKDLREIKCAKGDENALTPIMDLSRGLVCRSPSEYTIQEALDLLNAILVFMIIFVLGKLAYDYYYFKKTGRLPWIVTKLP